MNAYTRKHRNGNYSARLEIPGLIEPRCWKNGKRVKCPRKPRNSSISSRKKTKRMKSKSQCWDNAGKRVKCSTIVPPMLRWLIKG
jgi:hypothetical protein